MLAACLEHALPRSDMAQRASLRVYDATGSLTESRASALATQRGRSRACWCGSSRRRCAPASHPVVHDCNRVAARIDGIVPIQILIEGEVPWHFKDPAQLAHVAACEQWLESQPEIGGAIALVDYLGVLYRAFVPDAPAATRVPPSREMTDQLLLLGAGNNIERFAAESGPCRSRNPG